MEIIEVDGRKFRAVDSPKPGACGECALKQGFGCRLAEVKGTCLPYCSGAHRPDGKDVNWLPAR